MPKPRAVKYAQDAANETSISFGTLPDAAAFHLRVCQEASFRIFASRVGDPTLKPQRYAMLTLIAENPGITQTVLSRCCGRDKSTLTATLGDLRRKRLVQRRQSPEDRRRFTLHLTPAGHDLLAVLHESAQAHDRAFDRILGDQKRSFIHLLRKVTHALEGEAA